MKTFSLLICLLWACTFATAQDVIVKKNGKEVKCKITREDSLSYYIVIPKSNNEGYKTYINKSDVQSVMHGNQQTEEDNYKIITQYDNNIDLIFSNSGQKTAGIITGEDSLYYYVTVENGDGVKKGHVKKSDVSHIAYNYLTKEGARDKYCLTIGLLEGGGSLIGADFEFKVSEIMAFQVGAGFLGYGAGLNLHIKPTINSSFISLQYWHQGIGAATVQEITGLNYVFRGKSILTAQIGLGVALSKGPAFPKESKQSEVLLMYALGIRFPW